MKIHEKISHFRKDKGMTQQELADKVFVTVQTINQYEKGKREIKAEMLERLSNALDINLLLLKTYQSGFFFTNEKEKTVALLSVSKSAKELTNYEFEWGEEKEVELLKKMIWEGKIHSTLDTAVFNFPLDTDWRNMDYVINCLLDEELDLELGEALHNGLSQSEEQKENSIQEEITPIFEEEMTEEEAEFTYCLYGNVDGIKTDSIVEIKLVHEEKIALVRCSINLRHYTFSEIEKRICKLVVKQFPDYQTYIC